MENELVKLQNELKVPKLNENSFGKYKYRSCEDILEAVKPLLLKYGAILLITDSIESIGNKIFLKATAQLTMDKLPNISVCGYAELAEHKGMSAEQATGTASSYARKYALNGLFLIDETNSDADSQEPVKKQESKTSSPARKEELTPAHPKWFGAIQSLVDGKVTISQIRVKYELSQNNEELLINESTK